MRKRSHLLELAILGLLIDNDLHGYEIKRRLTDVLGIFSSLSFGSMYPALARLEASGAVKVVADTGTGRAPDVGAHAATGTSPDHRSAKHAGAPSLSIPLTGSLGGERAAMRAWRTADRSRESGAERSGGVRGDGRTAARAMRGRKVYAITESGATYFREFLDLSDPTGEDEATFTLRLSFARHLDAERRLSMLEQRRAYLVGRLARERRTRSSAGTVAGLDTYARSIVDHSTSATESDISWLDSLIQTERSRIA